MSGSFRQGIEEEAREWIVKGRLCVIVMNVRKSVSMEEGML